MFISEVLTGLETHGGQGPLSPGFSKWPLGFWARGPKFSEPPTHIYMFGPPNIWFGPPGYRAPAKNNRVSSPVLTYRNWLDSNKNIINQIIMMIIIIKMIKNILNQTYSYASQSSVVQQQVWPSVWLRHGTKELSVLQPVRQWYPFSHKNINKRC